MRRVASIDFGTTRASLEELRKQAEMEVVFHQTFAAKLNERSQRLQEFREKWVFESRSFRHTV